MPRLGRAVGLCVAAHVGVTVGWVVFIAIAVPGSPGLVAPGLASFSPFMGVMLATLEMQIGPSSKWDEAADWVTRWIFADAALAALLLEAVLVTFNRCLGRVDQGRLARAIRRQVPGTRGGPERSRASTGGRAEARFGRGDLGRCAGSSLRDSHRTRFFIFRLM